MDVQIKFDPQQIYDISVDLRKQRNNFMGAADELLAKAQSLRSSWDGAGMEACQQTAQRLGQRAQGLSQRMEALCKTLQSVSGIYTETEASVQATNESLPTEGVFL